MKTLFSLIISALTLQGFACTGGHTQTFFQIGAQQFHWKIGEHSCKIPPTVDVIETDHEGVESKRQVAVPEKIQFVFRLGQEQYRFVFATPMAGEWTEERFEVIHTAPGVHTTLKDRSFVVQCAEWENGDFKSIAVDWAGGKLRINSSVP